MTSLDFSDAQCIVCGEFKPVLDFSEPGVCHACTPLKFNCTLCGCETTNPNGGCTGCGASADYIE